MNIKEKVEEKFNKLINEGQQVLQTTAWNGRKYLNGFPSASVYQRWKTEVSNLISKVCGERGYHHDQLKRLSENSDTLTNSYYFAHYYGLLEAVYNDYSEDFLYDTKMLISAELFDDLLSQAEYLLSQNFYIPAASIAGAVLEDSLRKLCDKHDIEYNPKKTTIDDLNTKLAKKQVYTTLVKKDITAKADIRNNADHGHTDKFNESDVGNMVSWIRRFVTDYIK